MMMMMIIGLNTKKNIRPGRHIDIESTRFGKKMKESILKNKESILKKGVVVLVMDNQQKVVGITTSDNSFVASS